MDFQAAVRLGFVNLADEDKRRGGGAPTNYVWLETMSCQYRDQVAGAAYMRLLKAAGRL